MTSSLACRIRLEQAEQSTLERPEASTVIADQQRALLFQCLRCADPSPDSKHGVLLKCAFGNALLATDPRTGGAMLRLTYR